MIDVNNILTIIEEGQNTGVPADVIVKAIKQYCEKEITTIEQNNNPTTEGGNND